METEFIELYEGEYLDVALFRKYKDKNIPSNVILDKTLTGIGATYTELHSKRNSIIIEPNVPVIVDKARGHDDWLTVYSPTTISQIRKYLSNNKIRYKKILTTPEGFKKIRKAAGDNYKQMQDSYFCLFDECEKLTQDCDYRAGITQPVYDFFEFENKAFVSATPLKVRHPKFEEQGFKKIKIVPQFDYKKNLHLIVTNSYDRTVREELEGLKDSQCVCIFINSVSEINKLVYSLDIMDESYIFCSEEGVKELKEVGFNNAKPEICHTLRKYNFFTSRFYSALDINLEVKPDILILTNLNQAYYYTMIDPYTETIQIQGRFRTKFEDGNTYNSLTHITNTRRLNAKSEKEVRDEIDEYIKTYQNLTERYEKATDTTHKQGIKKQLKKICEDYLLDEKENIDYFGIDNKYNEERVKGYYLSSETLFSAYRNTDFFNVNIDVRKALVGKDDILRLKYGTNNLVRVRYLLRLLSELDKQGVSPDVREQTFNELSKTFDGAETTVRAYKELPTFQLHLIVDFIFINPGHNINADKKKKRKENVIKVLEEALNNNENEEKRFSPAVINELYEAFSPYMGRNIPKENTVEIIRKIYSRHGILYNQKGISAKLNQQTIKDYFDATPQNKEKPNKWKIKGMKPELAKLAAK